MSKTKRILLSIAVLFIFYSLGISFFITYLFGALKLNLLNSPVFIFLLLFNTSLVYVYILLVFYVVTQYNPLKKRKPPKKRYARIVGILPGLSGLFVALFVLAISPAFASLREGRSVFSFGPLIFLWISLVATTIGSFTVWAVLEKKKPKMTSQDKVARIQKSIIIGTICAILLSTSFATYIAVPDLQNQRIIPHGGGVYFEVSGGYATYFLTALRDGEVNGSVSSTANFTLYLLNSTQFAYLVSESPVGAPPLPANFTLQNYCYTSGNVKSVNFEMSITPGNYYVVLFNRGGNGTLITADWFVYSPNSPKL